MKNVHATARSQSTDVPPSIRSRVAPQRCPLPYDGGKDTLKV